MSKLENWTVVNYSNKKCLIGYVYDDRRFEDGHRVLTSEIIELDEKHKMALTKSGTKYELGEKYIAIEKLN